MIASSAEQAEKVRISAFEASQNVERITKKIKMWSIVGGISAVIAVVAVVISIFSLIQDANSRYDGMVQKIDAYTSQISTLEQKVDKLQKKLDQEEKTKLSLSDLMDKCH